MRELLPLTVGNSTDRIARHGTPSKQRLLLSGEELTARVRSRRFVRTAQHNHQE